MVIRGTFTAIHVYYLTRMTTNGPVNGRKYYSFDTSEPNSVLSAARRENQAFA